MESYKKKLLNFRNERDWKQYHTPENLAKSLSIEANELLEHFQWTNDIDKQKVCEELADVFSYTVLMADALNVDLISIAMDKLEKNKEKYPVEKAKGNCKKYTEL